MAKINLGDSNYQLKRLAQDANYYNNVFKKTEKVVSVIFYILAQVPDTTDIKDELHRIKDKSLTMHEQSLKTLELPSFAAAEGVLRLQYALLALESELTIVQAARILPTQIVALLFEQIDVIQRQLQNHYQTVAPLPDVPMSNAFSTEVAPAAVATTASKPRAQRQRRVHIPSNDISSDAYFVHSQLTDRAERIKTVLEAKPDSSIKDIAEIITDVSEKTIQRELNSLIDEGQVRREGERRWSRYSVIK